MRTFLACLCCALATAGHGTALGIESETNQFIVLRGHELPEVEDVIAERKGFLIVSKRGAGAEFVREQSSP